MACFQLIYNFTLLNFFDFPLQEWQTILDKTAPSPLPLEEDWNKFFYQTIDLYRRWEPYGLLSIILAALLLLHQYLEPNWKQRATFFLKWAVVQTAMITIAGIIGYKLKI